MFGSNCAAMLHRHTHYLQRERSEILHDPRHIGVPLGVSKISYEPMVRSTQTMPYLVSRLALSLKGSKQASTWVLSPSGTIECVQNDFWAYGTSSANHAPISHWYYHYLLIKRSEITHDPCHLGVPLGASKTISEPMLHATQTMHRSCIKISTVSKWTKLWLEPHHLGVPSGASKKIFKLMVRLAQIVHLSCIDSNIVSKEKEPRFHMTHIS
jgi:hypothetical protein